MFGQDETVSSALQFRCLSLKSRDVDLEKLEYEEIEQRKELRPGPVDGHSTGQRSHQPSYRDTRGIGCTVENISQLNILVV